MTQPEATGRVNTAMEALLRDVDCARRMFRESPACTATAVLTLALGIGVNTAIFSVVNAVLLKPLPAPDPERFVFVMNKSDEFFEGKPV